MGTIWAGSVALSIGSPLLLLSRHSRDHTASYPHALPPAPDPCFLRHPIRPPLPPLPLPEFCHLHCHTQYSLLDGAARIKNLVGRAADMEIPALAITDHGNLFGVPEFYTTAKRAGVQPIVGCEFYVSDGPMSGKERGYYHQVLLAKNETGYRNLIRLSSLSYTGGFYYKPRIDRATLRAHSEGLVATTCCLQGEVLQAILKKSEAEALAIFKDYLDIFGEDYYVEIQDHGIPEQRRCNAVLLRWAEQFGVGVVATNDVHYVEQSRLGSPGCASLPPDRQGVQRPEPDALRERPVLPQVHGRDAGGFRYVRRRHQARGPGARHDARDRRQVHARAQDGRAADAALPAPPGLRGARSVPPPPRLRGREDALRRDRQPRPSSERLDHGAGHHQGDGLRRATS